MSTTSIAKVRSLLGGGYRLSMLPRDWLIRQTLSRVGSPHAKRCARVLDRLAQGDGGNQNQVLAAIEAERERLLATTDPLADGTLGTPGIYDAELSIRDACKASKPPRPCLLMHLLVREFVPRQLVELGTNLGISSAYQAAALRANGQGHITTFEASPYRLKIARDLHSRLGLQDVTYVPGLFEDTLEPYLKNLPPIDFAFIDGHHQYRPTLHYCNEILEHAAPDLILVFDDIRWSKGMQQAWRELKHDRRFHLVIDLHGIGLCFYLAQPSTRRFSFPAIYHAFPRKPIAFR